MLGALLGLALAGSPCIDTVWEYAPEGEPAEAFEPTPTDRGIEVSEETFARAVWRRQMLAACLIELRAAMASNDRLGLAMDTMAEMHAEAIKRNRPTWAQRHGLVIGVTIGALLTIALVAAVARTLERQ